MKRMFLEKFFPASRTEAIRKEIYGIRQHTIETLHEFNKLYATCPHHQTSEQLLIQYFYKELIIMDRSMIDAASGGPLMDKTPIAARNLISNMTSNTQQFDTRGAIASRAVNKVVVVDNQRLENKIIELTSLVRQLAIGQHYTSPPAKVCGICTSTKHPIDACPTLQEIKPNSAEVVGLIGGQQYGSQQYDRQQYGSQQYDRKQYVQIDPRVILKPEIRFYTKHTSEPKQIPTTSSQISSTTLQTTTTITNLAT
ncbi:hypothetical protein CR513_41126, partial [Mucuna pruriens]